MVFSPLGARAYAFPLSAGFHTTKGLTWIMAYWSTPSPAAKYLPPTGTHNRYRPDPDQLLNHACRIR